MIGYALLAIAVLGFGLMATGFARLFAAAWKRPDRKQSIIQALGIQPGKSNEWPNNTYEAKLIALGAVCGFIVFLSFALLVVFS